MPTSLSTEIGVALPTGWRQLRAKHLLREVIERSESSSIDELLTVSQYSGVTPTNADTERAGDISTYKRCRAGDLVVNTMLAWNGSLGVAPRDGVVSPAYSVYRFFDGTEPAFFSRMLRTPEYRRQIAMRSSGVVESRLRLYPTELYNLPLLVPSLQQQKAIVRFLEEKERDIEHYLATKRSQLAVLQEMLDQVVSDLIADVVKAERAPSVPLKHLVTRIIQGWSPQCEERAPSLSEWGVMRTSCVTAQGFDEGDAKALLPGTTPMPSLEITPGSFLVTRGSGSPNLVGRACLVRRVRPRLMPPDLLYSFRVRSADLIDDYLEIYLRSSRARQFITLRSTGGGGLTTKLPVSALRELPVVVPSFESQMRTCRQFAQVSRDVLDTMTTIEREIAAMEEYRTRLIADAVTGQIDVRGLA